MPLTSITAFYDEDELRDHDADQEIVLGLADELEDITNRLGELFDNGDPHSFKLRHSRYRAAHEFLKATVSLLRSEDLTEMEPP